MCIYIYRWPSNRARHGNSTRDSPSHIYMQIYTCVYIYMYTTAYIYIYMYTYVCVYMQVAKQQGEAWKLDARFT